MCAAGGGGGGGGWGVCEPIEVPSQIFSESSLVNSIVYIGIILCRRNEVCGQEKRLKLADI